MEQLKQLLKEFDIYKIDDEREDKPNPFEKGEDDGFGDEDFESQIYADNEGEPEVRVDDENDNFGDRFVDFLNNQLGKKYKIVPKDEAEGEVDGDVEFFSSEEVEDAADEAMSDYDDEFDMSDENELEGEEDFESPDMEGGESEEEDEDFQGVIRTVAGANLVYKRRQPDGNYEELWIYNIGRDVKHEAEVKRAILAGTDIDPSKNVSDDGSQHLELHSTGNVQFLQINGLPN